VNTVVKARHMDVTDAMRQHVQEKLGKLPRIFGAAQTAEVTLDVEAGQSVVEIVVEAPHRTTLVATHRAEDMYACIDQCYKKMSEQLRRHKDRVKDHKGTPLNEQLEAQD